MKRRLFKLFSDSKNGFLETWNIGSRILKISFKVRKKSVILYLFGAIIETFGSVFAIFATAKLFSLVAGFSTGQPTNAIWFWLIMDTLAAVVIGIGFWIMSYESRLLYFSLNKWTVHTFMSTMCLIDIEDFYKENVRNQINKVKDGYTWQIPNLAYTYLELVYGFVRFGAIALIVAQISWWLIAVVALFLIPSLLSEGRIAKIQWLIWGEKGDNRHIYSQVDYMVSRPKNQMEIRAMETGDYIISRINDINEEFYNHQENSFRKTKNFSLFAKIFEIGGIAIGAIVLLKQFLNGFLSLDRYFFLNGALFRVGGALNLIFGTLSRLKEPQQFAESFFELIDIKPRINDKTNPIRLSTKKPPEIEFRNLSFSYPGKTEKIFENLNLIIESGEHVALVGENGAGKSTLIKLLLRFYRPSSGQILLNGVNIEDIEISSFYSQLATLFQEFNQYPFSIKENVELADTSKPKSKDKLIQAIKLGGVKSFSDKYRFGLDTVLDSSFKKGTEPSGGQWQRVAISRAFYRDAKTLILDEPTSAIDAKTEHSIFNRVFDEYKNKTTIIVSHRFSTVRKANKIVVLDKGKIVEQGSHQDLIKKNGVYKELFSKQAEGYIN